MRMDGSQGDINNNYKHNKIMSIKLSIVVPVYNEAENIELLHTEIRNVMQKLDVSYEVIFVNDGSKDESFSVLQKIAEQDISSKVINFRRNFGQTAAMSAGFDMAKGEVIIPLDADLQNDPNDIPNFLEKIDEGYDIVSGWRKDRKDNLITRKIPSWIANAIISKVTKVELHDYGCSMKAYRSDVLKGVRLYGEMHRFIPAFAAWNGAKMTEIIANHRARR